MWYPYFQGLLESIASEPQLSIVLQNNCSRSRVSGKESQKNLIFLKSLGVEKMATTIGGWELVCDIDWGFMLWGSDWFYGYFEVSNCRFIV